MNNSNAAVVIIITLVIVVAINALIIFMVKNRKPTKSNKGKLVGDIAQQVRRPFQKENNALKDLSDRVEKIKEEINTENFME